MRYTYVYIYIYTYIYIHLYLYIHIYMIRLPALPPRPPLRLHCIHIGAGTWAHPVPTPAPRLTAMERLGRRPEQSARNALDVAARRCARATCAHSLRVLARKACARALSCTRARVRSLTHVCTCAGTHKPARVPRPPQTSAPTVSSTET